MLQVSGQSSGQTLLTIDERALLLFTVVNSSALFRGKVLSLLVAQYCNEELGANAPEG
jgi:hypothetical protein